VRPGLLEVDTPGVRKDNCFTSEYQKGKEIVPVEIKSGKKGSMQSLFLFLKEKNRSYGLRFSIENYSKYGQILSCPLYGIPEVVGF
jgi:hypothetical protein